MSKLIMATSIDGMRIDYVCKSIRAKYRGRKCKDYQTPTCMTCELCEVHMRAKDARRLLARRIYGTDTD